MWMKAALIGIAALGLSGCMEGAGPAKSVPEAQVNALVAEECALYVAAARDMNARGQAVRSSMLEGCEAGIVSADLSTTVTRQAVTRFPELIYRRMLARGVSSETALKISKTKAYWDLADTYAATYG